jgi:hypothetical protein
MKLAEKITGGYLNLMEKFVGFFDTSTLHSFKASKNHMFSFNESQPRPTEFDGFCSIEMDCVQSFIRDKNAE